ncbi:kinase-like domain-containing protein [Rhexocercosporidium sp. MPI-PUGE-AT-0058]|nr:kinase-like domain-containing protein [Rhexocercosporidium sp. MPI-PUGE-AT-0058]
MMGDANRPSHLGEAIPKEPPLLWTTSQTDQFELAFQSPEKVPLEYLDDLGSTNKPGDRGATVSRERSTETGLVLAAKSAVFKNTCEDVKSEVEILRKLVGTRHIIQIVGTFMCGPNYTILLFPATQYNLSEYLSVVGDKDPDSSGDDKKHLSTFFGCLAKGLEYIHNSGVRHKDVKPENILVDLERKTICHADFGISKDFSGHDMSSVSFGPRVRGSKMYLSPECSRKMERSRPSDIFSLGCVFSEIWTVIKGLTLKEFYEQRSRGSSVADFCKTLDRVLAWIYHLDLLEPLSEFEEMGQVIISMLDELPSRRPSAKRVWAMFAGMTQVVAGIEHFEFCGSCCTPRPAELTRLLMANTSPKVELRNSAQEPANYEGVLAVILSWPTASNRPSYADRDGQRDSTSK